MAWLGRTSTEDQQDPTLSLPRQLNNSRQALPPGYVIVAHFYDVESGRKDLDARGHGTAHERFDIPIPRDGGVQDLLKEAAEPDRCFVAVICESIDRVARRTYFGIKIEYELERAEVMLLAADEPMPTDPARGTAVRKRSTPILTRRVKQAVAEWYVLQMLEMSWDGTREHTQQGWNIGRAPYGYQAERIPHPVPARRAEGKTKTRLIPDPVTGPVVTQIYRWRAHEHIGYREIADRLNDDLEQYPPPEPTIPARRVGRWTSHPSGRSSATRSTPGTWCGIVGPPSRAAGVTRHRSRSVASPHSRSPGHQRAVPGGPCGRQPSSTGALRTWDHL